MSTQTPIQWEPEAVSPGLRRPGSEAEKSTRVIVVEAYTFNSPYLFVVCRRQRLFLSFLSFCVQTAIKVEKDKRTAVGEMHLLLDVGVDGVLTVWMVC
jgi:hypothetical protein